MPMLGECDRTEIRFNPTDGSMYRLAIDWLRMRGRWWRRLGAGSILSLLVVLPVTHLLIAWTSHPAAPPPPPDTPLLLQQPLQTSQPPPAVPAPTSSMPTSLSALPPGLLRSYTYTLHTLTHPQFVDDRDENIFKSTKANLDVIKKFSNQVELIGNIAVFKDVIIDGDSTCYGNNTDIYRLASLSHHAQSKGLRSINSACPIMVKDPSSVHTFLSEILPRIVQVLPLLDHFKNTPIMLKWTTNPLILEMLSSLRVPYIFHHSQPVRVTAILDTCQTPAHVSSLWHRGRQLLSVGNPHMGAPPQSGSVIVISSHHGPRLLNVINVMTYLKKRFSGHDVVELDTSVLSFDTYRETFSNARLVIGTLSEALNAVYFCHQGAKVLEVVPIHAKGGAVVAGSVAHAQTRYWLMSNVLGLSHWRMYETAHSASGDVTLSLARLRRILDSMGTL